jgi:hypothetical protein
MLQRTLQLLLKVMLLLLDMLDTLLSHISFVSSLELLTPPLSFALEKNQLYLIVLLYLNVIH